MGLDAILVILPKYREQTFVSSTQGGSTYNLALISKAVSEEKISEKNCHLHVSCPRAGVHNTLGSKFFHKHKSSVI